MTGIPRLVYRLLVDRRVPLLLKLMLVAAVAYILLPIDVVPDIVPVLGRIDDALVLVLSIALFLGMAPREVVTEHLRGGNPDASDPGPQSGPDQSVIDGEYHVIDDDEETAR